LITAEDGARVMVWLVITA